MVRGRRTSGAGAVGMHLARILLGAKLAPDFSASKPSETPWALPTAPLLLGLRATKADRSCRVLTANPRDSGLLLRHSINAGTARPWRCQQPRSYFSSPLDRNPLKYRESPSPCPDFTAYRARGLCDTALSTPFHVFGAFLINGVSNGRALPIAPENDL